MEPALNKKQRRIAFIIFLGIMVVVFFIIRNQREHRYWRLEQKMLNQKVLRVVFDSNHRYEFFRFPPSGHSVSVVGGGDYRLDLHFYYGNQKLFFKDAGRPILVNLWEDCFYMVTIEGEPWWRGDEYDFCFYKYTGEWTKIEVQQFPKQLALPNIYYHRNFPEKTEADTMDPKGPEFAGSITEGLWLRLGKGIRYRDWSRQRTERYKLNREFLISYKTKYIDPYWGEIGDPAKPATEPEHCRTPKPW